MPFGHHIGGFLYQAAFKHLIHLVWTTTESEIEGDDWEVKITLIYDESLLSDQPPWRSLTSRYHGRKISRSQQFFLTETAICIVERWKKRMVTVLFLSAIMHRKVIHVIFFFLLYLQDHGLLRTRNFLPRQRHVTTTLHPLRIHSPASSVFLYLRKEREQLIEELFGNQDRHNLLTCNDTNPSRSQKKSISVISSQG